MLHQAAVNRLADHGQIVHANAHAAASARSKDMNVRTAYLKTRRTQRALQPPRNRSAIYRRRSQQNHPMVCIAYDEIASISKADSKSLLIRKPILKPTAFCLGKNIVIGV